MNDDLLEQMSHRVANGELLQFTPKARATLVDLKKALGLTSEQAEQAVRLQEESDRARGLLPAAEVPAQEPEQEPEQEPGQEGEPEPEPVPGVEVPAQEQEPEQEGAPEPEPVPGAEVPAQEQEPEQKGESEPEPVPASAGKGKAKK